MITKYHNGTIYLGDNRYSNEVYVNQEGLVASERDYYDAEAREEIDLKGQMLIPAFRDAHAHPLFAGRESLGAEITGLTSLEHIGKALKDYRAENPGITWLDGASYDRNLGDDKTRQALDQFVPDIPVVLHAEDHHTLWVNTRALEVAGLLRTDLPVLSEGGIDLGNDGLPNGILREWQAMQLVLSVAPKFNLQQDILALRKADELLLKAGIIEVQDAWIERGMAEVYLAAADQLNLEYKLGFRVDAINFEEDFSYALEMAPYFQSIRNVKAHAIKFFIDGVFGSATAAVIDPYLSNAEHGDLNWTQDDLVQALNRTHAAGFQAHIHAIGDKAVAFALDALELATPGPYPAVIAHVELTNAKIIAKAKGLGVFLCMQPFWAQYNGMLTSCVIHLGDDRVDGLYSIRSMLEADVDVVFSSDWPVSSYKPLDGITVALHRRFSESQIPHNPTESISLEQALDAYSKTVCRMFRNSTTGMLDVGQPFDAVLLSNDLTKQNLGGFLATEVLAVYRKGVRLLPKH